VSEDALRLGAETSVRSATAGDTAAIGAIQARAWHADYPDLLRGATLARAGAEDFAAAWRAALASAGPGQVLLVACAGVMVVGFAAVTPSADADAGPQDGELRALEVDPAHRRAGHGSRLLAAASDSLRQNGFRSMRCWVAAADEPRRGFLASAGMGPDGARRRLGGGDDATLTMARLSAGLAEE